MTEGEVIDISRNEAKQKLQEVFGHKQFRRSQWGVIKNIFDGNKVLLIEKTGFGKSLCYQFPSLYFSGITLVFSPLIALMRDQVNYLQERGIAAACITSENSASRNQIIIEQAQQNQLRLLYVAPERQNSHNWEEIIDNIDISFIVIDEAHCISVWGHDFRPAYRKLIETIKKVPDVPILGSTATATEITEKDIAKQMGENFEIIRGNLSRSNLELNVINTDTFDDKVSLLVQLISQIEGVGIVFAGTRAETELIADILNFCGIKATHYHAGILNRQIKEQEVVENKWKCVVATNSFGMGIDKADFRFIIHTQFPASPIHYYQEIGRAGRDGKKSYIFLLWEKSDVELQQYFINTSKPPAETYYETIEFVQQNEGCTVGDIQRELDLQRSMVENVMTDLIDQGIIDIEYEIEELLPKYYLANGNSTEQVRQEVGEHLKEQDEKVTDERIKLMLETLATQPATEYQLATEVFDGPTNANRELVVELIDTLNSKYKSLANKDYIEMEERYSKTTYYYPIEGETPPLNERELDRIRDHKHKQLRDMLRYLSFSHCRMEFLCQYLGDKNVEPCDVCDYCRIYRTEKMEWSKFLELCVYNKNTTEKPKMISKNTCGECEPCRLIDKYYTENYPTIDLVYPSERDEDIAERKMKVLDGIAATYDFTSLGKRIIKVLKEEPDDPPDKAIEHLLHGIDNHPVFQELSFDLILYIPSSENINVVRRLAKRLANRMNVSLSHKLVTKREVRPETEYNTWLTKKDNVKDAFSYENPKELENKSILLVGDIYHSKATIREIGRYLSQLNVKFIVPVYLIKSFE